MYQKAKRNTNRELLKTTAGRALARSVGIGRQKAYETEEKIERDRLTARIQAGHEKAKRRGRRKVEAHTGMNAGTVGGASRAIRAFYGSA